MVLLISCNHSSVYTEYYNFNNQDWNQNKMLVYSTPDLAKSTEPLVFEIHLRHNIDYKYRNIWLFTELELPNGTIKKDTIQKIFMQTNGEWMPDVEGSGNVKESHVTLFALKDAPEGKYILKVQHAMRDEALQGILDVGFKINKIQ